ncbi:MAG: hypothetical protein JSS79_15855 [Bacteroidetes bacterium]|nr:hypothetical protein [Bacteroidota bacterium]
MFALLAASCIEKNQTSEVTLTSSIIGTWQLISETKIVQADTTVTVANPTERMIKIINATHFAFLKHDLKKGQDSVKVFVAGGGTYTLKDNHYVEHLDYCNYREWEANRFEFEVTIKNDTLVQQGREKVEGIGVDRIIIEKYIRTKE